VPTAVKLSNIGQTYASNGTPVRALSHVNTYIDVGEFAAIIGPSGCGKTTLLNIVAGLLAPTEGDVAVEDGAPSDALARRRMGLVFQDPALLHWRTAEQNVRLPLELLGEDTRGDSPVSSLFSLMRLDGFERNYPRELSGGMKSRVAIARALATSPAILLADAVVVVLGFDDGDGDVGLQMDDIVRAFRFSARYELPANDDAALGEIDLFADASFHPSRRV
jgi:ABC-type nitrate/sulfonate/bicarbonate transport system ATPase subunit